MTFVFAFARRHARRIAALAIILSLGWLTRLPALSDDELHRLASRFTFTGIDLPLINDENAKNIRNVNPSLDRISAWISSVGASVALNDIDGDGLANDVCYVNTPTDMVIVAPVPGSNSRYSPFSLRPENLHFDELTTAPMGCLPGDFNEDGLMDILVYYWGRTPVAFLRNYDPLSESGHLSRASYTECEISSGDEKWFTNAGTVADLDGDGHLDLVFGNYFQDNADILDVDGDENQAMQHSMSRAYNGGRNRFLLWQNASIGSEPSVSFRDVEAVDDARLIYGWTLAVGAADLDGDLLPEIYFGNDFGPDRLLHNRSRPDSLEFTSLVGEKHFTTPNSKALGRDSFKGMGVDFGDINGDGYLDIYVSNIANPFALLESHFAFISTGEPEKMKAGIAPYDDCSEPLGLSRSGWGWEARLADFDNDGILEAIQATGFVRGNTNRWPELQELAMANDEMLSNPQCWPRFQSGDGLCGYQHNYFFVRAGSGRFYDIASEVGLGEPVVTRGIATADVDGDGDLDFAQANQWDKSKFFRNDSPNVGVFLGLHLLLPLEVSGEAPTRVYSGHPDIINLSGSPAIGASVIVNLPDGRRLVSQVDGGNGHSGKRSPDLHFGLGNIAADRELAIEIHWRDRKGIINQQTFMLTPGWHTVLLGSTKSGEV